VLCFLLCLRLPAGLVRTLLPSARLVLCFRSSHQKGKRQTGARGASTPEAKHSRAERASWQGSADGCQPEGSAPERRQQPRQPAVAPACSVLAAALAPTRSERAAGQQQVAQQPACS